METADWYEKLARSYLYWAPHEWLALRGEYRYEILDRDIKFTFNAKEVKTNSVPLAFFLSPVWVECQSAGNLLSSNRRF